MEDVLSVYKRPYDPARPVVCMDEKTKQLIADKITPIPPSPGNAAKEDYEYKPKGTRNIFFNFEPLTGQFHVDVTERRTKCDWAHFMRHLADDQYPHADKIVCVLDNLNTHGGASFYAAFAPSEARRLVERFEFHATPKHGSWLNMAEIGLSILDRECPGRRIGEDQTLVNEVAAWESRRAHKLKVINWRFTTDDARLHLRRLYPEIA